MTEVQATESIQKPRQVLASWALFAAILGVLFSIASAWYSQQRANKVEQAALQKLASFEAENKELRNQVKALNEQLREQGARQALAETKLTESLAQQSQLEKRYEELARSRGEIQLSDIEASLNLAAQQLQYAGNIKNALLALQDADARLERMNQPPLIGVRRSLAKDIERLKQRQAVDPMVLAGKVDLMLENLPSWRLISEPAPVRASGAGGASGSESRDEASQKQERNLAVRLSQAGQQGWSALKAELLQIFRVQRVDSGEALLLAPEQAFFVRENMKLRLMSLRLAVLARNESAVSADVAQIEKALKTYFDPRQDTVVTAQQSLQQIREAKLAVDLPSLNETFGLLRSLRGKQAS